MTRHNLDSQISWLLSHEVTFPPTVHTTNNFVPTAAELEDEEFLEAEIAEIPDQPRVAPAPANRLQANVAREFIRPSLPAAKSQSHQDTRTIAEEPMGRLASSSRSSRPGLLTQHQLATPASTSGTTSSVASELRTTSRPGLTGNYVAQLAEERGDLMYRLVPLFPLTGPGTPSARGATDRSRSRINRTYEAPQTPRQTPRPTIETKHEVVDSIDLTGDDSSMDGVARSSSSEVTFGAPVVVWREDSASRAEPPILEPQPRTSKKRKSGDLSPERSRRIVKHSSERIKPSLSQSQNLDGFVDIDDVPKRPVVKTSSSPVKDNNFVQPSVESEYGTDEVEEYQVTETVSRIETRTRKSISRVPSFSGTPRASRHRAAQSVTRSTGSSETIEASKTTVQVAASPAAGLSKSPSDKHRTTPRKAQKRPIQSTIQDSDDEYYFSEVEKRASCSPRTPAKPSPRVVKASASPSRNDISMFSPAKRKAADFRESQPRVGSPLRAISQNAATTKRRAPSPDHQSISPQASSVAPEDPKLRSQRQTPNSSLGIDEKKLVAACLKEPSSIGLYQQRVINAMSQNAVAVMDYIDVGLPAPESLKEARTSLLDQNKAYTAINDCREQHKGLMNQKKMVAKQIMDLLDTDTDTSDLESRQSELTQEMRKLEKEVAQLLYKSGALKDGFGTDLDYDKVPISIVSSHKSEVVSIGSSATGNAQVILQTQLPSWQSKIAASYDDHVVQGTSNKSSSTFEGTSNAAYTQRTKSSSRRVNESMQFHEPIPVVQASLSRHRPMSVPKQPDFYREPSPLDYDFDGEEFNDLLEFEQGLGNPIPEAKPKTTVVVEDDYGDSQDDEELLEVAQNFDQHQSFRESVVPSRRPSAAEPAPRLPTRNQDLQVVENNMYSNVDDAESTSFRHPWSNDVKKALKERFKLTGFRKHQLEVINATLSGKDVFVLMPTGGGKSLCFQLPAIVQSGKTKGVTIVISPLLSLMQDQVDHLQALNIRAARISSDIAAAERRTTMDYLNEAHPEHFVQLLYVSPEMINSNTNFLNILKRIYSRGKMARIVIDEAHCVSHWGHDFRHDYVELSSLRGKFPGVPFIALTATATPTVRDDVKLNLGMTTCSIYTQSFNRPNLFYEVREKITKKGGKGPDSLREIADMIKVQYRKQTGIIYMFSRDSCDDMAGKLQKEYGIKAEAYHAQIPAEDKIAIQKAWQSGKVQVVVATIAFGMGIDKPDVRFVIHFVIPKSLEGYYQETGRAGRDGKRAGCYLYFSAGDTTMIQKMILNKGKEERLPQEVIDRQWNMFKTMQLFCNNKTDCRRQQVLAYFGEDFTKSQCGGTCDNCASNTRYQSIDFSRHAKEALSIVAQVQNSNVTLLHCAEVLRGASVKKVKELKHNELKEFGAGKDLTRDDIKRIFDALKRESALRDEIVANRGKYSTTYIKV
jgi:bloom syndrome protein